MVNLNLVLLAWKAIRQGLKVTLNFLHYFLCNLLLSPKKRCRQRRKTNCTLPKIRGPPKLALLDFGANKFQKKMFLYHSLLGNWACTVLLNMDVCQTFKSRFTICIFVYSFQNPEHDKCRLLLLSTEEMVEINLKDQAISHISHYLQAEVLLSREKAKFF